ncbi:hypothetical protein DL98DRAFT_660943 [Cadophora sp. DSE1049]|nr:hypothetical protein DL98DRAFT_660943 [Cadophora sp. DSE1049]
MKDFVNLGTLYIGDQNNSSDESNKPDWFSKLTPWRQQAAISQVKKNQPHSGHWLLQREIFDTWKSSTGTSVLWLHGIPGSGKSVLVSKVIEDLERSSDAREVSYFYCFRSRRAPGHETSRSSNIHSEDRGGCFSWKHVADPLEFEEYIELLISLVSNGTTYIVIDAVDELDDNERPVFFDILSRVLEAPREGNLRIFLASRDDGDVVCELSSHPNVYIQATDNKMDIDRYVRFTIEKHKRRFLRNRGINDDLKNEIISTLISGAHGMFLWVNLQIELLSDNKIQIIATLKKRLGSLPPKLQDSYDAIYDQIRESDENTKPLAERTIQWLLCAKRQLKTSELISALYAQGGVYHIPFNEADGIISTDDLLDSCRNLIVLDQGQDTFRLLHLSVREYFEGRLEYASSTLHEIATASCLSTITAPEHLDAAKTFRPYALFYWPYHLSEIGLLAPSPELQTSVEEFMLDGVYANDSYLRWAEEVSRLFPYDSQPHADWQLYEKIVVWITSLEPRNAMFWDIDSSDQDVVDWLKKLGPEDVI